MAGERGGPCWCSRARATTAATRSSSRAVLRECVLRRRRRLSRRCREAAARRRCRAPRVRRRGRHHRAGDARTGSDGSLIVDGLFGIGLARPLAAADTQRSSSGPMRRANRFSRSTFRAASTPTPALPMGPAIRATSDRDVHRAEARTADRRRRRPVRRRQRPCARPRSRGDRRRRRGHRLDWDALAAALPACSRARARNVHKGTFGTLGDRRRRRRHGRRAAARRPRGAARRRRQSPGSDSPPIRTRRSIGDSRS